MTTKERRQREAAERRQREDARKRAELEALVKKTVAAEMAKVTPQNDAVGEEAAPPSGENQNTAREAEKPNITDIIMAGATVGMLIVVGFQAHFNSGQVDEARRANEVATVAAKAAESAAKTAVDSAESADEQFKILNRPYIVPEKVTFREIKPGMPVEVEAMFRNTGKLPALKFRWVYNFEISDSLPKTDEFDIGEKRSRESRSAAIIGANIVTPLLAKSKWTINAEQIKALSEGKQRLYFYATVTYESVWHGDPTYTTTMCVWYEVGQDPGNHPGFVFGIATATGNELK